MARIAKRIPEEFSGKAGTAADAIWSAQDIILTTPKRRCRRAPGKQRLRQVNFRRVTGFLQPLKTIRAKYFGSAGSSKSRVNLAVSHTVSKAVQVTGDVPALGYSKVLMTRGGLAGFRNMTATPQSGNVIRYKCCFKRSWVL
ncbi:DUF6266 family protein [Chryseobacterium gregarium]|uniref:DUF6266 family protein n=1 Tax=Chryseobacterium gregarium TaxID=456299 RepID=UPI0004084D62|nr:DUF6266 family protein [Chryseobacterium gregarium]